MYFCVGVIVPLSRILEKVEVAAPLTYWLTKEVEEAGRTAAYSRSKRKVSNPSRMMSMAATQIGRLPTSGSGTYDLLRLPSKVMEEARIV